MIILEIFFALFVIAMILFGKVEFTPKTFKLSINIAGRTFPLISIVKKRDTNGSDNVSI
jgi:hypothetical protein